MYPIDDARLYESKRFFPQLLEVLEENDKTEKDVLWVGNTQYRILWEEFKELAIKMGQDPLYAVHGDFWSAIPSDLIVLGWDFLVRISPAGSTFWDPIWEYIAIPSCPERIIHPHSLVLPRVARTNREIHTLDEQVLFENEPNVF